MKPGDHVIRLVEPMRVARRRIRGQPDPEWTVEFRMQDGHTLHVGMKSEGDAGKLRDLLQRRLKTEEPEEPWDPDRDL